MSEQKRDGTSAARPSGRRIVAVLEDTPERVEAMTRVLRDAFPALEPVFLDSAPEMIAWLERNLENAVAICLDHDLGPSREVGGEMFDPGDGRDVAEFLAGRKAEAPVLIHTSNGPAGDSMEVTLQIAGWSVGRVSPFDDLAWVGAAWRAALSRLIGATR